MDATRTAEKVMARDRRYDDEDGEYGDYDAYVGSPMLGGAFDFGDDHDLDRF